MHGGAGGGVGGAIGGGEKDPWEVIQDILSFNELFSIITF